METPLEKALATLVYTFHKYSGREGDKFTLNKGELKELVKQELALGEKMKDHGIDKLMQSLDKNNDDEIDFKEYTGFLSALCMSYNEFFQQDPLLSSNHGRLTGSSPLHLGGHLPQIFGQGRRQEHPQQERIEGTDPEGADHWSEIARRRDPGTDGGFGSEQGSGGQFHGIRYFHRRLGHDLQRGFDLLGWTDGEMWGGGAEMKPAPRGERVGYPI